MVFFLNDHITDYYSSMYKINDTHLHDDKWEYFISPQILQYNNIFTCTYLTSFTQFWKTVPFLKNVPKGWSVTCFQLCRAVSTVWMANWLMFSKTGSKNTFTSRVVFWGQKVDAAWPWKTQTQNSSYKLACKLTNTLVLDMLIRRESTWSKLGWRSWRCVRFRYSSILHSNCVEKLKSWQCCSPLLHWRRKTCGSRALITMNSCSWGNFLSGRKGRSCRDGTEEGRAQ